MRINSERVESMNNDDKQLIIHGNTSATNQYANVSKQTMNLAIGPGGQSQQQTLNVDLQNKTQGYNFRAKKKSFGDK